MLIARTWQTDDEKPSLMLVSPKDTAQSKELPNGSPFHTRQAEIANNTTQLLASNEALHYAFSHSAPR